ncbi:MAG: hypothetical protein LBL93_06325 [Ruminococcus sp.]|jgi:hypothetical protein|nr:hypothetical protein [Ruminococcus sp.]
MKKLISIFLIFALAINLAGCGSLSEKVGDSREKGVEKYLEEKYGKDFVIERVAFGYFWYYMKDEPQYHYYGSFGNKEDDSEFYKEYGESFYYDRNFRILSDYFNEKIKRANSDEFIYVDMIWDKLYPNYSKYDISAEEFLKSKSRTKISMDVFFSNETGDIDSENVKDVLYEIYNEFFKYNEDIEVEYGIAVFSKDNLPTVKEYYQGYGSPSRSDLFSRYNIEPISSKVVNIHNGKLKEIV